MVHYWVRRLHPREFFFFFFFSYPSHFLFALFPFFWHNPASSCLQWHQFVLCDVFLCVETSPIPGWNRARRPLSFLSFFFDLMEWLKHYSIVALSSKGTDKKWFKKKKSNSLGHNVQPGAFMQKWKMSIVLPSIILPISLAHNTGLWLMDINSACSTVNRIMINITFISGLLHLVWPWVL